LQELLLHLASQGPDLLSDETLLSFILGGPEAAETARRVGTVFPEWAGLRRASLEDLTDRAGLDPMQGAVLQAAIELGRRIATSPLPRGRRLGSSCEVYRWLGPRLRDLRREIFLVVLLDGRNRRIADVRVSEGSLSASIVHPREVFLPAIRISAAAIIVVHNHPSGDPRPSPEDREVTSRLAEAGHLLGIRLLDHVIVGEAAYYSFADEGSLRQEGAKARFRNPLGYGPNQPKKSLEGGGGRRRCRPPGGGAMETKRIVEQRRSKRKPLVIQVEYGSVDEFFSDFSSDINEGGMFIETAKKHVPGSTVRLEFALPGSSKPVTVNGRIIWVRKREAVAEGPPGIGIEFEDLSDETKQEINKIVISLRAV
jgi:DNA repair protein RadC